MTEFTVSTWFLWAVGLAVVFSIGLNVSPFLPGLRELKPSRIEARWVGYTGLTLALWLWIIFNPEESVTHAGVAWLIICLATLIPNTLVHLYRRDNGDHGDHGDGDSTPGSNGEAGESPLSPLNRRQQTLLENALAEYLSIKQALEVQGLMLKALHDPRYRRDPDEDSIRWRKEVAEKPGEERGDGE